MLPRTQDTNKQAPKVKGRAKLCEGIREQAHALRGELSGMFYAGEGSASATESAVQCVDGRIEVEG